MSQTIVTRNLGCRSCRESGKQYTYSSSDELASPTGTENCSDCKGRKTHQVKLIVTHQDCNAAGSWSQGKLECKNGVMRNTREYYEYGKNFLGQETRKKIAVNQESEQCPFCFGTGKTHFFPKKENCSKCRGWGELTETRWEKGFFGGEVKREYRSTCPDCKGAKFSWVIDHILSSTQVYKSNF